MDGAAGPAKNDHFYANIAEKSEKMTKSAVFEVFLSKNSDILGFSDCLSLAPSSGAQHPALSHSLLAVG